MSKTRVSIDGIDFLINGKKTYSDISGSNPENHGLLWNARFIQGIFDDKANPERFARFGFDKWDPEAQTDRLIEALPEWYKYGLRAFSVGLQGGGPCFTIDNLTINNNPFSDDGTTIDPAYLNRLDRLIRAADEIGMVVIVTYFYGDQVRRIKDGIGVRNAVKTASNFLRDKKYTNTIINVSNEMDIPANSCHKIIQEPEGMAYLIDFAREESGGMLVGCSGGGGFRNREISESSDIVLIHGNNQTRQHLYNMISDIKKWTPDKPIVCNEDSNAIGQIKVAEMTHTSWGYYNNMTKQEPPTNWVILPGEDTFFALRMALAIGIEVELPPEEDQFYMQGLEPHMEYEGKRWLRIASLYPEKIDYVEFFKNNKLYYTAFDEPFSVHFLQTWKQGSVEYQENDAWTAFIYLRDGRVIKK